MASKILSAYSEKLLNSPTICLTKNSPFPGSISKYTFKVLPLVQIYRGFLNGGGTTRDISHTIIFSKEKKKSPIHTKK